MANKLNIPKFVITDGDEGVQLNEGVRIALGGAGYKLPGVEQIVKALQDLFQEDLFIAATANSAWMKKHLDTEDWEQVNALSQQHVQALADKLDLHYAGYLPFSDPKEVKYEIKGHMVRPEGMHLANKICFTTGGGEQTYNLGQYLISADWVSAVDYEVAETAIKTQIDFYHELAGKDNMEFLCQSGGKLGKDIAEKNQQVLAEMGIEFS